jgi:hypothetical protein
MGFLVNSLELGAAAAKTVWGCIPAPPEENT